MITATAHEAATKGGAAHGGPGSGGGGTGTTSARGAPDLPVTRRYHVTMLPHHSTPLDP